MLLTFKSKAAGNVIMYEKHAKPILDLLHKDVERGILTPDELPDAIAKLEAEIAKSKVHSAADQAQPDVVTHQGENSDDDERKQREFVSFSTRVYPLLEMLRAAQKEGHNVMWGV